MTTMNTVRDEQWERVLAEHADTQATADVTPETYAKEGDILESPDGTPMRISRLRFQGYVPVWDTRTGDMSLQPWWLLWQTMRKTREDGSLVFTRTDPKIPRNYGMDIPCPLHPEAPEHPLFPGVKGMGFKPCRKRHIPTEDALQRHVQKSHKRAYSAAQAKREEMRHQEILESQRETARSQREFTEAMMRYALGQTAEDAPEAHAVGVADSSKPVTPQHPNRSRAPKQYTETCSDCGEAFTRGSRGFARKDLNKHRAEAHGT